jgi:hypothetical protein
MLPQPPRVAISPLETGNRSTAPRVERTCGHTLVLGDGLGGKLVVGLVARASWRVGEDKSVAAAVSVPRVEEFVAPRLLDHAASRPTAIRCHAFAWHIGQLGGVSLTRIP